MYGKIQITGTIEIMTGIHIGGSSAFAAIGAVDSPVVKDARTNLPIIPGSSLKGKMRTLLAKQYNMMWVSKVHQHLILVPWQLNKAMFYCRFLVKYKHKIYFTRYRQCLLF